MKVTRVADLFIQIDSLHKRIDLQRPTAHILALVLALLWAFISDNADAEAIAYRFGAAAIFLVAGRLLLCRLSASRLSALLLLSAILYIGMDFSAGQLMVVNAYAAVLLLAQEYFIRRGKFVALATASLASLLIAGTGEYARSLLFLLAFVMISRVLWHAILERMGKKAFVLFAAKAVVIAALVPGLYAVLRRTIDYSFNLPTSLPPVDMPVWAWVVLVLLMLRGLWATLLLKTDRSPGDRPLRMFYVIFGGVLLGIAAVMERVGDRVFTADALEVLSDLGLTDAGIASLCYAVLAGGLLATAALDRTLFKDTIFAKRLGKLLGSSDQVSPNKK